MKIFGYDATCSIDINIIFVTHACLQRTDGVIASVFLALDRQSVMSAYINAAETVTGCQCVCVCVMNSGSWSLKVSFNMARQEDRGSVHMRMFVCTMQSNAAMKTQHISLGDCCMTINKAVCFRTNTTYWWCMFTGNQVIITSNKVSLGYLDKNRLKVNMKLHSQAILLLQCDAFWGETGYSESASVN